MWSCETNTRGSVYLKDNHFGNDPMNSQHAIDVDNHKHLEGYMLNQIHKLCKVYFKLYTYSHHLTHHQLYKSLPNQ